MAGFRNPGYGLTANNRFAQMLMDQNAMAGAPKTHAQGLAQLLRTGLSGWMMGEERRKGEAADKAYSEGMTETPYDTPWTNPDTGAVSTGFGGGVQGAMTALKDVEGEKASGMRRNLATILADRKHQAGLLKASQDREDQRYQSERYDKQIEGVLDRDLQRELKQLQYGTSSDRPFQGTSKFAQIMNMLHAGDTHSKAYETVYNLWARGVGTKDQFTGLITYLPNDMKTFTKPGVDRPEMPMGGAPGQIPAQGPVDPYRPSSIIVTPQVGEQVGFSGQGRGVVPGEDVLGVVTDNPPAYADELTDVPESLRKPHVVPAGMNENSRQALAIKALEMERVKQVEAIRKSRRELRTKGEKEVRREANMLRMGGPVVEDLGRARELIEGSKVVGGMTGSIAKYIPLEANDVYQINGFIKSVYGNISINEIMQMKSASEGGGALGQIPIGQMQIMMELLGQLDPSMRREILLENIDRIQNIWLDMIHGTPEQIKAKLDMPEAEIQRLVATGELSPQRAAKIKALTPEIVERLSQRRELSFDERGRSIKQPAPQGVTEEQIQKAMKDHRIPREEVIRRLGVLKAHQAGGQPPARQAPPPLRQTPFQPPSPRGGGGY